MCVFYGSQSPILIPLLSLYYWWYLNPARKKNIMHEIFSSCTDIYKYKLKLKFFELNTSSLPSNSNKI